MFQRDKDLRAASGRRDDRARVLEKAKEQRAVRALQRERESAAERIRGFLVGRFRVRLVRQAQRRDFDAKISDIGRLKTLLQRPSLPLPFDVLFALLRALLFFYNGSHSDQCDRVSILSRLFVDTLTDTATAPPAEAALSEERKWQLRRLLDVCLQAPACASESPVALVRQLSSTYTFIADHVSSPDIREYSPHTWQYAQMPCRSLAEVVRAQLLPANPAHRAQLQHLVAFAIEMAAKFQLLEAPFVHLVLSVPLLPKTVDDEALLRVSEPPFWDRVVAVVLASALQLPQSPSAGIPSITWLLGNLLWLADRQSLATKSDHCVLNEVKMLTKLLQLVPPETFAPTGVAVSWTKISDAHSVPVVYPDALNAQLRLVHKERRVREICDVLLCFNPSALRRPLSTERPAPMHPSASTVHEQYGFGDIASTRSLQQSMSETWQKVKSIGSASWAKRLLEKTGLKKPSHRPPPVLRDTSSHARHLATTGAAATAPPQRKPDRAFDQDRVFAVATFFATFISRWPPHGRQTLGLQSGSINMINVLSFYHLSAPETAASTHFVAVLWSVLQDVREFEDYCKSVNLLRVDPTDGCVALLTLLCVTYSHLLVVLDDQEMYADELPLPLCQVERIVAGLKHALHAAYWVHGLQPATETFAFGMFLVDAATKLLRDLYDRCSRLPFCNVSSWVLPGVDASTLIDEVLRGTPRGTKLISCMPYVLSFPDRVKLFQRLVLADKAEHQGEGVAVHRVRIRRGAILEDGLAKLNPIRSHLKKRINVVFVNAAGREEVGIDAGGLFKEFWLDLAKLAFDLEYGLFLTTGADGLLYPNPHSASAHFSRETDHLTLFQFLGRILGKALYEGIVVEPKFAQFFLSKLLHSFNHLSELPSLDPELYKNLLFLKSYDGDVADLALTFTVTQDVFGAPREVELIPNGAATDVTDANRTRYIHLVANFYLNTQIREQSAAFRAGLADLVDPRWLRLFNEPELQVLVSGKGGEIDVADLKAHTKYAGGYFALDKRVQWLWQALESFTPSERGAFLRFATSCQRAPSLGFGALTPPFCVQKIPIRRDDELLPSSSTCFNTLKLPTYSSYRTLRAKLLLTISAGAGFEMT